MGRVYVISCTLVVILLCSCVDTAVGETSNTLSSTTRASMAKILDELRRLTQLYKDRSQNRGLASNLVSDYDELEICWPHKRDT